MSNLKAFFEKNLTMNDLRGEFQKIEREHLETGDNDAALIAYRLLSRRILKTPKWGDGELIDLDDESMAA